MNAQTNDQLRQKIPYILPPDILVVTAGIASLGQDEVGEILRKVKDFNSFNPDNDPYQEHDFGLFDHNGDKIYWKIDDYNGQYGYNLLLTVMLAEEY
jgi:hypothetical protein